MRPNVEHVKKYLALYCSLLIIIGLLASKIYRRPIPYFGYIVPTLAFLMIYPMMVTMRLGRIKEIVRDPKAILLNLLYAFIFTPIILLVIVRYVHEEFAVGLLINLLIPGPSLAITLTALSDGDIELASIAMATNFILVPVLLPSELYFLCGITGIHVPISLIIRSIVIILILPIIVGQITRYAIIKHSGHEKIKRIKPKLSEIAISAMFAMILLVFYNKGPIILRMIKEFLLLIGWILIYIFVMMIVVTLLDIALLSYKEHAAISYIVIGKNNSLAIAITSLYFKGLAIVAPIAYGLVQSIVLTSYVRINMYLKRFFKHT